VVVNRATAGRGGERERECVCVCMCVRDVKAQTVMGMRCSNGTAGGS